MSDLGHEWGPHERGLRWVQCQQCGCLLHEPEAKAVCTGDRAQVEANRAERNQESLRLLFCLARLEAGEAERQQRRGYGLFQHLRQRP